MSSSPELEVSPVNIVSFIVRYVRGARGRQDTYDIVSEQQSISARERRQGE